MPWPTQLPWKTRHRCRRCRHAAHVRGSSTLPCHRSLGVGRCTVRLDSGLCQQGQVPQGQARLVRQARPHAPWLCWPEVLALHTSCCASLSCPSSRVYQALRMVCPVWRLRCCRALQAVGPGASWSAVCGGGALPHFALCLIPLFPVSPWVTSVATSPFTLLACRAWSFKLTITNTLVRVPNLERGGFGPSHLSILSFGAACTP